MHCESSASGRTHMLRYLIVLTVSLFIIATSSVSIGDEVDRGKLLYENHCQKCHDSGVHLREGKKVKTLVDLSKWVIRWQHHLELDWSYQEIRDVMYYVNNSFYKIPGTP